MALFNHSTKEVTAKVVYYGPGLCGKTTNLQWIHERLPIRNKGMMLSLATETDRTLFFDFLSIKLGAIRGMTVRMQLYTVPGQVLYNASRRMVLKGADGIVFVGDSQDLRLDADAESMESLRDNLIANEFDPDKLPMVLQYNKRDLPNALPIEILNERLNPNDHPHIEAVAIKGVGVEATLKAITGLVFRSLASRYGDGATDRERTPVDEVKPPPETAPSPKTRLSRDTQPITKVIAPPTPSLATPRAPSASKGREESLGPRWIFLCHSTEDKQHIVELYARLKRDGMSPWLDSENILPGQDWDFEISKAIRESQAILVCLSRDSIAKEGYVQKEIKRALDVADEKPPGAIFIIPVRLQDCVVPEPLRRRHWVDLFDPEGYAKLMKALRTRNGALVGASPSGDPARSLASDQPSSSDADDIIGVRIGAKGHALGGFSISVLITNYFDRPVRLQRIEMEWWLADDEGSRKSKPVDLSRPLERDATDREFKVSLSDYEAASSRPELVANLRLLYRLLRLCIRVWFYHKGRVVPSDAAECNFERFA